MDNTEGWHPKTRMEFRYGISPPSLFRWITFERLSAIQAEYGLESVELDLSRIIESELRAIEKATARAHRASKPVPLEVPKRRRFSSDYKRRILREAANKKHPGDLSRLLRREGLYGSYLTRWRQQPQPTARPLCP